MRQLERGWTAARRQSCWRDDGGTEASCVREGPFKAVMRAHCSSRELTLARSSFPSDVDGQLYFSLQPSSSDVLQSVSLHTSHGDLKIEIFCEPHRKQPENFLALAASGYYDNVLFHRNIKTFMVQTGDPTGSGKGGQSIWDKPFENELKSTLKVPHHHPPHRRSLPPF